MKPLPVEMLVSAHSRRGLTVNEHQAFRETLSPARPNEDFDDLIQVDPYNGDPPSRRKDGEVNRLLSILASIENERGNQ